MLERKGESTQGSAPKIDPLRVSQTWSLQRNQDPPSTHPGWFFVQGRTEFRRFCLSNRARPSLGLFCCRAWGQELQRGKFNSLFLYTDLQN